MWRFFILGLLAGSALAAEVCYAPCGCFSDDPPFDDRPLPWSPEAQGLVWRLYTLDNIYIGIEIDWDNIPNQFDPSKPTKYLIHGWLSTPGQRASNVEIKNAFLENGYDYNIINIDWTEGADVLYDRAATNTRVVGACSGYLASVLQDPSLGHCIGHSLGGHACGYQGNFLDGTLGRITGLDTAGGDKFEDIEDSSVFLNTDDAVFVDGIHTNSYGESPTFETAVCHVDFYPHNGGPQPPCHDNGHLKYNRCDHWICTDYFLASVAEPHDDCAFISYPCDNYDDADNGQCDSCFGPTCQSMGYYADQYSARGKFYLELNPDYPYCKN